MRAALVLLENLADATQSMKLHFFFAVLLTDSSNELWSGNKYSWAHRCERALLHALMSSYGIGNGAHACVTSSTIM